MDPFVNMTLEGKAVKQLKRTPADKDGGGDPTWVLTHSLTHLLTHSPTHSLT